jgi:hypothetical protein
MSPTAQLQVSKDASMDPYNEAMQEGFIQERMDTIFAPHSAYSYEDLPSNKFGIEFALKYFNPKSNLNLADQIENYLVNVLGAILPTNAPNWKAMPARDSKNPPSQINKTTKPIYTSEDVKKLKQLIRAIGNILISI